jgi:CRP/FNR family cyclic AMP-dependent transcriptional regulator
VVTGQTIPELLAGCEFFASFDPESLEKVAAATTGRALSRNDPVFAEDDAADELYVVRHGRVAIANLSPEGRESVVALMEPGDLFGEMALFDGQGRSAHARALEPTELAAIPYATVREVLDARPELLWGMVRLLAGRLRTTDAALADSVFLDVNGRTAKRLLELAGEADEFVLPVTQEELAALVGASRERVNKALAQFGRLGWIEQVDRRYRILDRVQLERRAR